MSQTAIFAAGCFWGVEATFRTVEGVIRTDVGYIGGHTDQPTYQHVCTGKTGHAEAIRIVFDPARVSYEQLLEVFWAVHDPTQRDGQGQDVGTQYRSAIFCTSEAQEAAAIASKQAQNESGRHETPVVTEITAATAFWPAEEYHQQYLAKRGQDASASTVVP